MFVFMISKTWIRLTGIQLSLKTEEFPKRSHAKAKRRRLWKTQASYRYWSVVSTGLSL